MSVRDPLQLTQSFKLNAPSSNLSFLGTGAKAGSELTATEVFGFMLARIFSKGSDGWEALGAPDAKVLECLAALRNKGWALLWSDVIVNPSGSGLRTFYFEHGVPSTSPPPPPAAAAAVPTSDLTTPNYSVRLC